MKRQLFPIPESDLKELIKTALEELIKEKPEMFKGNFRNYEKPKLFLKLYRHFVS